MFPPPFPDEFRSASVKISDLLTSPMEGNPAKNMVANRLQWVRSSIRKKLDMNLPSKKDASHADASCERASGNQELLKRVPELELNGRSTDEGVDAVPLKQKVVEDITESKSVEGADSTNCIKPALANGTSSPGRTIVTHGDPLGALDVDSVFEDKVVAQVDSGRGKDFIVPDCGVRLFVDNSSSQEFDFSDELEDNSGLTSILPIR